MFSTLYLFSDTYRRHIVVTLYITPSMFSTLYLFSDTYRRHITPKITCFQTSKSPVFRPLPLTFLGKIVRDLLFKTLFSSRAHRRCAHPKIWAPFFDLLKDLRTRFYLNSVSVKLVQQGKKYVSHRFHLTVKLCSHIFFPVFLKVSL